MILPEGMDDEAFVTLFGMGSTKPKAGKEMEAIRPANFLTNPALDPYGKIPELKFAAARLEVPTAAE